MASCISVVGLDSCVGRPVRDPIVCEDALHEGRPCGGASGGGEDGAGRGNEQVAREAVRAAMQGRRR